jgi:hypothetical protein
LKKRICRACHRPGPVLGGKCRSCRIAAQAFKDNVSRQEFRGFGRVADRDSALLAAGLVASAGRRSHAAGRFA